MAEGGTVRGLPSDLEEQPTGLKSSPNPVPSLLYNTPAETNYNVLMKSAKVSTKQEIRNRTCKEEAFYADRYKLKHVDRNITTLNREQDLEDNAKLKRLADKLSKENKDSFELIPSCQKVAAKDDWIDVKRIQEIRKSMHEQLKDVVQRSLQLQLLDNPVEVHRLMAMYRKKSIVRNEEFQEKEKSTVTEHLRELDPNWIGLPTNTTQSMIVPPAPREEERATPEIKEGEIKQRQTPKKSESQQLTNVTHSGDANKEYIADKMQEELEKRTLKMDNSRCEIMREIKERLVNMNLKLSERDQKKTVNEAYLKLTQGILPLDSHHEISLKEKYMADIALFQDYVRQMREQGKTDDELEEKLRLRLTKMAMSETNRRKMIQIIVERKAKLAKEVLSLRTLQIETRKKRERIQQETPSGPCEICFPSREAVASPNLEGLGNGSKALQHEFIQLAKDEERDKLRKDEGDYYKERVQTRLEMNDLDKVMEILKNPS